MPSADVPGSVGRVPCAAWIRSGRECEAPPQCAGGSRNNDKFSVFPPPELVKTQGNRGR